MNNIISTAETTSSGSVAQVADFWALLKPGVMYLVVFTGFSGLMIAPGTIHPFLGCVALLCIAIASGGAGAINMWYDRDIDAIMTRTKKRPIPAGRMAPDVALSFGVILSIFSVMLMGLAVNWTAAILLALANGFYVFVYTMFLKRRTPQNIVIGGAAGAFPPMVGWAAVTGTVSVESIVLFLIIFMWTPPHFWALALYKDGDYAAAKIPMLPVVAGRKNTKWQMLVYTVILLPLVLAPVYWGVAGMLYGGVALAASLYFLYLNICVLRSEEDKVAKKMFFFSIFYLFLLFAMLIIDRAPGIMSLIGGEA
ncbi:heme o synthase [Kiloniella laminariae]|uniref:heme o synthase n=1 Tax=Kiloniella laminariae TaxID=454162 RepID=UPI000380BD8E|nr:heme o synthase [Kiloniella laminariae]